MSDDNSKFKGMVHPQLENPIHLLTLILFQTCKTIVHLRKTSKDIFNEI